MAPFCLPLYPFFMGQRQKEWAFGGSRKAKGCVETGSKRVFPESIAKVLPAKSLVLSGETSWGSKLKLGGSPLEPLRGQA